MAPPPPAVVAPEVEHELNLDGGIVVRRRNTWTIAGHIQGNAAGVYVNPMPSRGGIELPSTSTKRKRRNPSSSGSNTRGKTDHQANVPFSYRDSKSRNFTPKKKRSK